MASTRIWYLATKREAVKPVAVKPTNFVRYKDGDIAFAQEVIINNPIQNNRWNALNKQKGKVTNEGTFNFDLDFNESVHFLSAAFGTIATADISSATDASVFQHTLNVSNCALPSLTMEQLKGPDECPGDANNQAYELNRYFGVMVDTFTIAGGEEQITFAMSVMAHGTFQKSNLLADAGVWASVELFLESVEWLVSTDSVNIFDQTPQSEQDPIASIDLVAKSIEILALWNSYTTASKAKVEILPQTPDFSTPEQLSAIWEASFRFWTDLAAAAIATETNIENWEIGFENQLEARYWTLRKTPSVIAAKGAKMTLKYTQYFEDIASRDKFLDLEAQAIIISIDNGNVISWTDTNNSTYSMTINVPSFVMTTYEMPTGTDDLYAVNVEGEFFYDETTGNAVEIIIDNEEPAATYA